MAIGRLRRRPVNRDHANEDESQFDFSFDCQSITNLSAIADTPNHCGIATTSAELSHKIDESGKMNDPLNAAYKGKRDVIERIRMDMWAPPVAREAAAEISLLRDKIRTLRHDNERLRKLLDDFTEPKGIAGRGRQCMTTGMGHRNMRR